MDILIKNVTVLHKISEFHKRTSDIHIRDGRIINIDKNIDVPNAEMITGNKLFCTIGLCDIGTHSGEPGYEHRETIDSLTKAALSGGYTALAVFPDTKPVIQTKGDIEYLKSHKNRNRVNIYPIGALSKDNKGVDIAEYIDMGRAGAVAFSQGISSIQNTGLLDRSIQYAKVTNLPVIHHPDDHYLSEGGEMHEGETSTLLGMKGIPSIAEVHTLQRDILLVEYNNGTLIEHTISTNEAIDIIKNAKLKNVHIYATVAYLNLIFTDKDVSDFDTNLKVLPPLRAEIDRKSLINGLNHGEVDAIVSNHTPLDKESKIIEFPYAVPGASGIETCLAACLTYLSSEIDLETIVEKLTIAPRTLLNITMPEIKVGAHADLCIFDTEKEWTYDINSIQSKSSNNPFLGKTFKGKVIFTIV